ncbi:MAG: HEAT repeat domain-containing protein [Myxococcota bacterium]
MNGLFDLRTDERRDAVIGFLVLFGLMASHALLETTRDALFLTRLGAKQLPWAYLLIAGLAFVVARLNQELLRSFLDKRRVLSLTLLLASVATVAFWGFLHQSHTTAAYALYVWTGLIATTVVVQLWMLLGDVVTVSQAKRIFGYVAAGGVIGATTGSLIADRLVEVMAIRHLMLVAAGLLMTTAVAPLFWSRRRLGGEPRSQAPQGRRYSFLQLCGEAYLRRLLGLVVVSTVAVTGGDFLFKSVADASLPDAELGPFFARFYLLVNGAALLVQLFFASYLFRVSGVGRALFLLPGIFLAALTGFAIVPGLLAAAFLKGADGTLRHSVHRTGLEVLYLPIPRHVRERFKEIIDGVGTRGAQGMASLAILGALAFGAETSHLVLGIGVLVAGWLALLFGVRRDYVNLFRQNLREGTIDTKVDLSQLDLNSLEALLEALNSEHDEEVLAALDLFERHQRTNLVPVLILYHPSRAVVLRALDMFATSRRSDFLSVARRLLREPEDEIRAAALRAMASVEADEELLCNALEDDSPIVYATALVGLLSNGMGSPDWLRAAIDRVVHEGSPEAQRALATAICNRRDPTLASELIALAQEEDVSVRLAVVQAMAAVRDERFLPHLLPMLAHGRLRTASRDAFLAVGPPALSFLEAALADESLPRKVRRHIPRTLIRFEPTWAASILLSRLEEESDGAVRYKILRGLGRLRAENPTLKLNRHVLQRLAAETLERAVQFLDWRVATSKAQADEPRLRTTGAELLLAVLQEKEHNALERVFRLLGLLHTDEDFHLLWQGVRSDNVTVRAASRELVSHSTRGKMRDVLVALLDEGPDADRLARATAALGTSPARPSYEARLVAMLQDESEAVRSIVAHHVAELGLSRLAGDLERARPSTPGFLTDVIERALDTVAPERRKKVPHVA